MEKISDLLFQIYYLYRTEPIKVIGFLLICAAMWFIYSETEKLVDLIPNPAKENAQFQASIQRDQLVLKTLNSTRLFLSADTIAVAQFHNGQYDLTNLPFTKITVTYVDGLNDLTVDEIYTTRPLSSMNRIMGNMWLDKANPQCVGKLAVDLKDPSYRARALKAGINWVALCPVTNILDYPIGYIALAYTDNKEPENPEMVLGYLRTEASRISGYLQDGVVNERN